MEPIESSASVALVALGGNPVRKTAHELLTRSAYMLPPSEVFEAAVGFTEEQMRMKEVSFASLSEEDDYRIIPEEYVLEHLTGYNKAHISDYYAELEQDESLKGIVKFYTRRELEIQNGPSSFNGRFFNFGKAPPNKKYLCAMRDGVIDLHMRASRQKGALWRDYFRKAEKLMHLQNICLEMIRTHQIELQSQQDRLKMLEYNRQVDEERQQRETADAKADEERQQREAAEAQAAEARRQQEAAEAKLTEERQQREAAEAKAKEDQAALAAFQEQARLDEIKRRFTPIPNTAEYYAPNGYLYLEASEDDFNRSVIGFGKTGDPNARLAAYQSKATGPGKRSFLKIWHVWNMHLAETVIKEVLKPWATPEQKKKQEKKQENSPKKKDALSPIEIFDIPYQSILGIADFITLKFQEITRALKNMADTMVTVASGSAPQYNPIRDHKKYVADLVQVVVPAPPAPIAPTISVSVPAPPVVAAVPIAPRKPSITPTLREKLIKYITEHPSAANQSVAAYYRQVRKDVCADLSPRDIKKAIDKVAARAPAPRV